MTLRPIARVRELLGNKGPKPTSNNAGITRRKFLRLGLGGTAAAITAPHLFFTGCNGSGVVEESVVPCQVNQHRLSETIDILSSQSRRIFTDGNEIARQFIHDALRDALGDVAMVESVAIPIDESDRTSLEHRLPGVNIGELHNVVARIPGSAASGRKIIICAHFDSTGEGINNEFAPGADDNASGVAALLEIARNLQGSQLPFDIELIAFNGEEYFKLGSKAYTAALQKSDPSILGVINLDTLGGNPLSDRLVLVGSGNGISGQLMGVLHQVNEEYGIVSNLIYDPSITMNSDHFEFQMRKIPAIMISENRGPGPDGSAYPGNLVVHTAADTMEALNMGAVAKATELTLHFLNFLAQDDNWQSLDELSLELPAERPCQNTTTIEEQPSQAIKIEGMNFLFLGGAIPLAASPVIPALAQRLVVFRSKNKPSDAVDIIFEIVDCMSMPIDGSSPGIVPSISIDSRVPLSPLQEEFEAALATVAAHERSHGFYDYSLPYSIVKEHYLNLYYSGRSLGTWDLLDDSVLLNFYPMAGHPKDGPTEGIASAGMAYTIFSATYRRIIALLALDPSAMEESLQNEPFGSKALNRVFRIIYDQTPDRIALRQNLSDIYEFIRVNHANGTEFAEDFC